MLISVHLPKTAGSSFRASLEAHFDKSLVLDYSDRPINQSTVSRNITSLKTSVCLSVTGSKSDVSCIHGHFMPLKYRWLRTPRRKQFVVWLRDPLERLASHYYYWIRDYNRDTAGKLRRQVVEENWTLEKFCFSREMQNIYAGFFWGFPVNCFDFIGITEHYEAELNYFATNFLESELSASQVNTNPEKEAGHYIDDGKFRSRLERFHAKDMQLYRHAVKVSEKRLSTA